jgi:Na+/melibiose symporter-like transporter
MEKTLNTLLAIAFPWIVFLLYDNPLAALLALLMQVTVIGWPFAVFWAWRTIHQNSHKPKPKKKTQELSKVEDKNEP